MHGLDTAFEILSVAAETSLLAILAARRLYRIFPVFSLYVFWQLISDLGLLYIMSQAHGWFPQHFIATYYSSLAIADVLELGILLEIAANVLSPAGQSLRKKILYFFLGAIIVIGIGAMFAAVYANNAAFSHRSAFIVMDTTAAILRLIIFLLLAAFAQVLGLSWKNHVLQLASGLAFLSIVMLVSQIAQSRLHSGAEFSSQYHFWGEVEAAGYLCTLSFWCYAFLKKEAPRKEFSPQMARILVSISGTAQRQRAALARTRDQLQ